MPLEERPQQADRAFRDGHSIARHGRTSCATRLRSRVRYHECVIDHRYPGAVSGVELMADGVAFLNRFVIPRALER